MKRWAVEQFYADSGDIKVKVRVALNEEKPRFEEKSCYDYYLDIFNSHAEAMRFARDARTLCARSEAPKASIA